MKQLEELSNTDYKQFVKIFSGIERCISMFDRYRWNSMELMTDENLIDKMKNYQSFGDRITLDKFRSLFHNADEKYKFYCCHKSNSMVKTLKDNPELCDSSSMKYFTKKYGPELAEQKYREFHDNKPQTTRAEYYISKFNCSVEEAEQLLKSRQTTFSLNVLIEKHGVELGTSLWEDRQTKWMNTLANKSNAEKLLINLKKSSTAYPYNACVLLGISEEDYSEQIALEMLGDSDMSELLISIFAKSWTEYTYRCRRLTEINYEKYKTLVDPQSLRSREIHVDHIYSVWSGFKNNIPIEIIAHPCNLRMLSNVENSRKRTRCDITIEELDTLIRDFSFD